MRKYGVCVCTQLTAVINAHISVMWLVPMVEEIPVAVN